MAESSIVVSFKIFYLYEVILGLSYIALE